MSFLLIIVSKFYQEDQKQLQWQDWYGLRQNIVPMYFILLIYQKLERRHAAQVRSGAQDWTWAGAGQGTGGCFIILQLSKIVLSFLNDMTFST